MLSALTLAEDGEVLRLVSREETVRVPVVVGARERRHHDAGRKGDGAVRAEEQRPHEPRIAAASFLTSGCPASIATSSVSTVMLTGLTLPEAEALTRDDFAEAVGGLPKPKLHCSVLAQAAVRNAITEWRAGNADSL